jgi:hypothetical protein
LTDLWTLSLTPACWWRRHSVGEERGRAPLEPRGSGPNGRRRHCFQCGPGFLRREEDLVTKSLARRAARRNLEVVLLPIGWCHWDLDALRLVQEASGGRFTLVEDVESPLEELRITDWEALEETFDKLAATPRERWATTAKGARLRALRRTGRTDSSGCRGTSRDQGSCREIARGDPARVVRHDSRAARASGRREDRTEGPGEGVPQGPAPGSQGQAEALGEPERRSRSRGADVEAQNESLEERLRGIENSVTWRLPGDYSGLRSVGDDPTRPASDDESAGSR